MIDATPSLEAAEGLTGREVVAYLVAKGWTARPSRVDGISILSSNIPGADEPAEFILPVSGDFVDEDRRVADALRTIGAIERRPAAEIARDIRIARSVVSNRTRPDVIGELAGVQAEAQQAGKPESQVKLGPQIHEGSYSASPHHPRHGSTHVELENAKRLLAHCALFGGLSPDQRNALVARVHLRAFSAGETIFLMDSPGDSMMAILEGNVRISVPSPDGKEIVLAILHPGEIFGEIALLDGKGRTADARALNHTNIAVLARREVLSFFEREPNAWPKLVEVLCDRLRRTDQHLAEMALLEIPLRLAKTLLRLLSEDHTARPKLALSQRELGNMVGASRESVNKCLNEWQRRGIVHIKDNSITIANRKFLEQMAEPDWS